MIFLALKPSRTGCSRKRLSIHRSKKGIRKARTGVCYYRPSSTQRLPMHSKSPTHTSSIILTQPIKPRHTPRTLILPIPNLLRQNPSSHPSLPVPLRRTLRRPRPVKPPPSRLIRSHLRFRISQQPRLIRIGIGRRVRVGGAARAGRGFCGTGGREDGRGTIR